MTCWQSISSGSSAYSGLCSHQPPCSSCAAPERRQPDHIALDSKGVAIGEFELDDDAILDGDTIRVKGMESTLRLIGVDTEETFKKERERRAFALGWELYLREMRVTRARR